ncbi:carbon monoxide dehydrogenase [Mesobaculum littorinae]|uniref:Carbon monoxide dehydrogenase n=1 Tax=Mesobaculum littorinae TaxID=2486419 RepID=A0A438ALB5_9RHOB|nr:carbon monoxide dehydrogenase subunit G [Mesobaculum littorinae]RVV99395.1 carbon monoxide dehydrogenase [Mesobaculum littorinae]
MELTGTRTIQASRETVWAKLNDPEVLKACIPGCEELTGNAEDGYEAVVKQKVGPVRATFKGQVTLTENTPLESYTLAGEGKGGVAGFAKGSADLTLSEVAEGTELSYTADIAVGGKLAQLGNRLISGFARSMTDTFFDRFKDHVEA